MKVSRRIKADVVGHDTQIGSGSYRNRSKQTCEAPAAKPGISFGTLKNGNGPDEAKSPVLEIYSRVNSPIQIVILNSA
jgi:hypothetical protein